MDVDVLVRRDRAVVISGLGLVTAVAMGYTVYQAWLMEVDPLVYLVNGFGAFCAPGESWLGIEMWMPPTAGWTFSDLVMLFLMRAIMMTAMMLPSVAPTVVGFATINRRRAAMRRPYASTAVFLGGYLSAWMGFCVVATLLNWQLHQVGVMSPLMTNTSPLLAGALLILAGAYQYTPLKHACLSQCRTPLFQMLTKWRPGRLGAYMAGVSHGLYCVGCCWALMLLMFVSGVMSLLWFAGLTLFVLAEKLLPQGIWVQALNASMIGAGVALVANALV